ncbi:MAG: O-antigen ligase family protein [Desulfuromonadaceae bacterium]|nr:O-antigen ligase family protein [Desulfuromonadaceae bacterium]
MFKRLNEWILPLTIIAFMGSNVTYLSAVFTSSIRWFFILALALQVILSKEKKNISPALLVVVYLYSLWCLVTTFWSEQYALSIMKAIAAAIVLFSCLFAGQTWATSRTDESQAFNYLGAFSIVTLAVEVLGYLFNPNAFSVYGMFQGYTYNPNVFGALAAIASTFFIWKAYLHRSNSKLFMFWVVIYSVNFLAIIMSQSRAALLMTLCILSALLFVLSARRVISVLYIAALLSMIVLILFPAVKDKIISQTIFKHSTNVLSTREEVWSKSLEGAQAGGWIGGGFGVSIGSKDWEGGFTANTYGREKGNSQLAVLEEIGVIGFIFYLGIILIIIKELYAGYRAAKSQNMKVAQALILGAIVGMIIQSIFEGWWVALGSIDAVLFWTTTGVGMGLRNVVIKQSSNTLYTS